MRSKYIKLSVILIVLFRLLLTAVVPLLDKTEARYGEIARLTYETNKWIMPQIDYGVPFWAKPPLSTWSSALSFGVLGVSEFAARLPSFLIGLLLLFLVGRFFKEKEVSPYLPLLILVTTPEFLLHMGVVSTDSTLLLSITLVMLSFWKVVTHSRHSAWGYLFFVGIALGMLSKGPIVIVLTIPPLFLWCLLDRSRFKFALQKLPLLLGVLIAVLITVPWYFLAEQQSPGFLEYFFVGEHFKRFTESGWSGDKYGFAKSQPVGMVWLFLLAFAFPWIQMVFYLLWKKKKTVLLDPWVTYLLFWLFWTPLFFTVSSNAIHTYILPSTIPIALLLAHCWKKDANWIKAGLIFPILAFIAFMYLTLSNSWSERMNTDKYVLSNQNITTTNTDKAIYYWKKSSYSGRFYAQRKTEIISNEKELDSVFDLGKDFYLLINKKQATEVSKKYLQNLYFLEENPKIKIYSNFKK